LESSSQKRPELRMRTALGVSLCCWVLPLMILGCGSVPLLPIERAVQGARAVGRNSVTAGLNAVDDSAPFQLRLRYNPVTQQGCDCPEFEVFFRGGWHRVFIRGSDEVVLTLKARAQRLSGVDQSVVVIGSPTAAKKSETVTGQEFEVFELESLP